uniref:dolichyl-phosphooligosaccharide-protein glycotransferase n=2 Tax=environmental samples TaxID=651140 RepID=A0A075HAA8_9ARCH|nr:putative membrane protein required for N-linked glycosylation (STT3) [uncultured marine thaumarchaeote KM3_57_F01]AIF12899.1 putative membrane protein required for N-linked glycosylation (STT3) [uncultured marine thaumarchaeote KM3_57_F02]
MNHRLRLLVIGILVISFSISFVARMQPADYGFELNEFDPFFNFRATKFIVDNGYVEYFAWHDDKSWYPDGRNVSATSQVMLHITTAALYQSFGMGQSLYDFTILFPVIIGSLTTIVIFALVRVLGGTTAGLLASLFFAVSMPVIIRGTVGWFKSEPLGLFYGFLGVYLFLSGIKSDNGKVSFFKLIAGGVFVSLGISSWGGTQFFVILLVLFFLGIPFLRKDKKFITWALPVFVSALLLTIAMFERPGLGFVLGYGGLGLIGSTVFVLSFFQIQKIKVKNNIRYGFLLLGGFVLIGISSIVTNAVSLPSFRYLNAVNPFLSSDNTIVQSVAEHSSVTMEQLFPSLSVLMIFSGIGVWLLFHIKENQNFHIKNDMILFVLIIGFVGIYISSAFIRLEIFGSIAVIVLASIGVSLLISNVLKKHSKNSLSSIAKFSFVAVIIILLTIPVALPVNANWINVVKIPPTILHGGTHFNITTNDWGDALEWIKGNTEHDAVIAAWWDYGYWITAIADRTTLIDNATINQSQIKKVAKIFLSTPDDAWKQLTDMEVDYVLVYVAAQKLSNDIYSPFYVLGGGGDEDKKYWILRIAEMPLQEYLYSDNATGTEKFWNNTLLGKMIPFTPLGYLDLSEYSQAEDYQSGYVLYLKDIKYDSNSNEPLQLVYTSPSFDRISEGEVSGIIIYKINKEYSSIP